VQQYVAGRPCERLTEEVACRATELLELHTGLDPDPDRSWSSYLTIWFRNEWTSTITQVNATGAGGVRLARLCAQLLSRYELPVLPAADMVHGDFRLGNILFDHGRVSGVIDIEALGSGTRAFDYATLLDHQAADDGAVELLLDAGSQVAGSAVLAYCFAHVVLDLVLFMHRRLPTADSTEPDRRAEALSNRVQLAARILA
jgi:Ser/Thr protein kinase RdoA (MazF antagonist)